MLRIIKTAPFTLLLSVSLATMAAAGPTCTTGKPCGDSCIAQNKTCTK